MASSRFDVAFNRVDDQELSDAKTTGGHLLASWWGWHSVEHHRHAGMVCYSLRACSACLKLASYDLHVERTGVFVLSSNKQLIKRIEKASGQTHRRVTPSIYASA